MERTKAIDIACETARRLNVIFGAAVRDVYLYGSYARGDYNDESDIDILATVDMDAPELPAFRRRVAEMSSALSLECDTTVSVTVKPFDQFVRYSSILPYYRNVLKEGIRCAV